MDSVWCVEVGDRVKNFRRKRDAICWLRTLTGDTRIKPMVVKDARGAYIFYGPGRTTNVVKATIRRCEFTTLVRRQRKPLLEELEAKL